MPTSSTQASRKERLNAYWTERFPVVIASAASALKSAFLVNGGGAVALLAFFGSLLEKPSALPALPGLSIALLILVAGAGLAAVATGLSFLAQYGYLMRRHSWLGGLAPKLTWLNITLVMLSYASFVVAGVVVYRALSCISG